MGSYVEVLTESEKAHSRIRPYARVTPLELSPHLSLMGDGKTYLKLENLQLTGSFKLRGAANKLLSMSKKEKSRGVITASSGNHGAAFAYLVKTMGINGTVYLPENTAKAKIETLGFYDAKMKICPTTDCVESEQIARNDAAEQGIVYISPYNDQDIITGQSTIACEILQQVGQVDVVIVPVGGGGLISGIGSYLKAIDKNISIIGCQPVNSPVMYESLQAGRILLLDSKPTLSDGTAGGIEQDSITYEICRQVIDDFILISEKEIISALKICLEKHFMLVEGAGALSIAAFMKIKERFSGKNVVLVVSGSKVSMATLKEIWD